MRNLFPDGNNIIINFLTANDFFVKTTLATLSHIYPGVKVAGYTNPKEPPREAASVVIIDTELFQDDGLDQAIELLPDIPSIILIKDFASVKIFGKYLTSRRSIVAKDDLRGMGLIQAVHHLLERQRLHEQLLRTSRHLKELSIKDELTGFYNNRHFLEVLTSEVKKANRYKRNLGLVIISIKNFSTINKTFGHAQGEKVLVGVSGIIKNSVRDVDIPARYGDNEIAVILPETGEAAARIVTQRMQEKISGMGLEHEGTKIEPVLSSGIAALGESVTTSDDLLRTAIGALIEAKRNSQSSICTQAEIDERRRVVRENKQIVEQLGERLAGISKEAFRNYFQSLMNAIGEIPMLKRHILPHSERVAFFSRRLAESMGLEESKTKSVYRAGLLHDAGKLAIDPEILTKPGRLTFPEQELLQKHPLLAVQILGASPFLNEEIGGILHHHERFDGEGYPEKLSGESIPITARIIAVAEAWDVMTNPQPYRPKPLSLDDALDEIKRASGTQFDPDIVAYFSNLIAG
jgi:diguanylate cyclase (GGDEF)-like protein